MTRTELPAVAVKLALAAAFLACGPAACQLQSPLADKTGTLVRFDRDDGQILPPIADAVWLAAWPAWLSSCQAFASTPSRRQAAPWQGVCSAAQLLRPQTAEQVRDFFLQTMDRYRVVALEGESDWGSVAWKDSGVARGALMQEHKTGLVTGYFEPVLEGSRQRVEAFVVPVYGLPAPLPTATRAELEASGQLQGHELLWVRDPLEAFLLQVQGSGRVHLTDGSYVRLAYAANNGHPYRSIGRWLVEQGELAPQAVSLPAILDWAHAHPQRVRELLNQNPRMVFFREMDLGDASVGPVGSLGVALTPGISVAVDPRYLPLGAPLLIQTMAPASGQIPARIAIAQDTGGAIHGALRIDWFLGLGPEAAQVAGRLRAQATVHLLVPRGVAPEALL